jgi:hypothetical protein
LASGVNTRPVSWEIVKVLLTVTSVPSVMVKVPPVGTAVTVIVKLSPSASVGVLISRAVLVASSSIFTVLSAAATGALLLGVGRTIDPPPPPPPPQAARVKEARLGNVRVLRFFLVDILQKNSLFIEKKKVGSF